MNGTIKMISPCSQKNCSCTSMTGQLVSKKFFIPPDFWKGMISRSVLTMAQKYPHHRSLIHEKVLDLQIASLWNQTFPITKEEKNWQSLLNGRWHKSGNDP
jgi:endonuclease I